MPPSIPPDVDPSATPPRDDSPTGDIELVRSHVLARAALNVFGTFVLVVAVYYVVPLNVRSLGPWSVVRFAAAGLVFIGIAVWQVREILRAEIPGLRAAQAVGIVAPFFLTGYATVYVVLSRTPGAFTEQLSRTGALYFAIVVFGSVGFGDITPTHDLTRAVVASQVLGGLVFIAFVVRIFFAASRQRQRETLR